jgi:hypothetical protein
MFIAALQVVLGAASLLMLFAYAVGIDGRTTAGVLTLERAQALGNLVSPAVPVVCLATIAYIWLHWQLNRLTVHGGAFANVVRGGASPPAPATSLFRLFCGESASQLQRPPSPRTSELELLLDSPWTSLQEKLGVWGAVGAAAGLVFVMWQALWPIHTVDGRAFAWFLALATAFAYACIAISLADTVLLWRASRTTLEDLARGPLGAAFGSLAGYSIDWRFRLRRPAAGELLPLAQLVDALSHPPAVHVNAFMGRGDVRIALADPAFLGLWRALDATVLPLALGPWTNRLTPASLAASAPAVADPYHNIEAALALQLAFVVRALLARVVSGLSVATTSLFLVLLGHVLYTFQGRSRVLVVDWVGLAISSCIAVWILVQMEKNPILSLLWQSTPGRVTFNRDFAVKIMLYGALPLVTIFTGLFPEVGESLFGWLAPVRQITGH